MRSAIKGVFIGVFLLALFGAIATRAGWLVTSIPRPDGKGAWMFSRATGLLAYIALSLDVVAGLLVSTRRGDRVVPRGQLVDLHGWLSPIALALVLAHVGVLLADDYVRFDVIDLLVPFASRRAPFAIAAGVIAGYMLLVVHLSFGMRKRIGPAVWRRLHYLSFAAFVLVTVHAIAVIDLEDAGATGGCTTCHGSAISSAPPKDLAGNTARTARGVGAHQEQLGTSTWHREIACSSCHTVPTTADAPGHRDGDDVAELTFDSLNPAGVYTSSTTTCSSQYCHGNGRASNGTISWLAAGPLACAACHATNGTGMSGDHRRHIVEENMRCSQCHGDVVDANMGVINAALHVNGAREVKMAQGTYNAATRQCSNLACHGTETW